MYTRLTVQVIEYTPGIISSGLNITGNRSVALCSVYSLLSYCMKCLRKTMWLWRDVIVWQYQRPCCKIKWQFSSPIIHLLPLAVLISFPLVFWWRLTYHLFFDCPSNLHEVLIFIFSLNLFIMMMRRVFQSLYTYHSNNAAFVRWT